MTNCGWSGAADAPRGSVAMSLPGRLTVFLQKAPALAIAFSGGVDSRFLAHAAVCCGRLPDTRLFHMRGPHVQRRESEEARAWALRRGFAYSECAVNPLDEAEVRANGRERCYHCKRFSFSRLLAEAEACMPPGFLVCDGSNASDGLGYRPGLRALRELGVCSPLAQAGMDKAAIRALGAATGLDNPGQRARPCLLTRYAYGLVPDTGSLSALAKAEEDVGDALARAGRRFGPVPDFRLRLTGRAAGASAPAFAYTVELHVAAPLAEPLARELAALVVARGFAEPALLVLEGVSGHYDRTP